MKRRFSPWSVWLLLLLLSLVVLSGSVWRAWRQEQLNQALLAAVERRNAGDVRLLLQQGANVETPYRPQKENSFRQYLKSWISPRSSSTSPARTPLLLTVQGQQEDSRPLPENLPLVQALLDHHANVNATDANGMTALMAACASGQAATVRLLLEHGADIRLKDKPRTIAGDTSRGVSDVPVEGLCALQYAFEMNENTEIMRLLLDHHADINVRDENGATLLIAAAGQGEAEKARLLISRGADLNAQDKWGYTALRQARNWPEIFHLLQQAGATK